MDVLVLKHRAPETLVENGRYSVDGDIITITASEICPAVDGVYRWTDRGGDLLFELIEDPCSDRALTLNNAILKLLHPVSGEMKLEPGIETCPTVALSVAKCLKQGYFLSHHCFGQV